MINFNKLVITWFVLIFFSLVFAPGCASKEEKKERHLSNAIKFQEQKDYNKALLEYKNVVKLDPKNDKALFEIGMLHMQLQQPREAFQAFSNAVSINPENIEAQLKIGQILLLGRRIEEAKEKAEFILKTYPDNIEALNLMAGIQRLEKDLNGAIETLERALKTAPDHFSTRIALGHLFILQRDYNRAEALFLEASLIDPTSRIPYIELSRIYGTKGDWEESEAKLKEMVQHSENKYQDLHVLALFYESRQDWEKAESTLIEAVKTAPKEDISPLINLGRYYVRRGNYEQALENLEKAHERKKDDLNILAIIAQLHFDFRKFEESESVADRILGRDSRHMAANLLKGRLALLKRDAITALERFDLVVRENPENALAFHFKALAHMARNELELAQQNFQRSLDINPKLLDARLALGELFLRKAETDAARRHIELAIEQAPDNIKALTLQGNLKIVDRDIKGAEEIFKKTVQLYPDFSTGYVRLGFIYQLSKRFEEAREHYHKALNIMPKHTDALGWLVGLYVQNKQSQEALKLCQDFKARVSDDPNYHAFLEYLIGNIYRAEKNISLAREQYEKSIATDPTLIAPYISLASISLQEGKIDDALEKYHSLVKSNPSHIQGHMALGTLYDQKRDHQEAEKHYRRALEIQPNFAPAANNLAWLLAHHGGNIDEALRFAQIAKEQAPNNPSIMDTLGYIYYLKGSYLSAIAELQDSARLLPDNPVVQYHLGLALHKNKQHQAARQYLEKALELDSNFQGADQARKVLEEMKKEE